ncbi:MAG: serine protease [Desulfobacteraceae bacterium]|jgi:S1-C subfamily serine protease
MRNFSSIFEPAKSKFNRIGAVVCIIVLFFSLSSLALDRADVKDSVVKIYAVQNQPDFDIPWNLTAPKAVSGSGCVIRGNRILTNAHVVSDHTFIEVRLHGQPKKHQARVVAISHEADLALLTVDELSFFKNTRPLEIGKLPEVEQEVIVYGFPTGGDSMSTTKGVISRIEHQRYTHSQIDLLAAQLDAAINPGNSGGPVMKGDHIVGVVMQIRKESENIGYMVPVPVIEHFLTDLEDGRYDGIPEDGIFFQSMENESLRIKYGLKDDQSGVLVVSVTPGSPASGEIFPGDVLLKIDGHRVADDGTVEFRPRERTGCNYYTQKHQIGEKISMTVLRKGRVKTVSFALDSAWGKSRLVPRLQYDVRPIYFVYGGLVFCPLTLNYILSWGENWSEDAPFNLIYYYVHEQPTYKDEEVVIITRILPSEINRGYENLVDERIVEVNGEDIRNLRHLISVIDETSADPFVVFTSETGEQIVLDRAAVQTQQALILKTYQIVADRSADLTVAVNENEQEDSESPDVASMKFNRPQGN